MGEVGIVVGVLAMFVALGSVFFSSIAVRRMEENNQEMIRAYVEPLKAQITEMKTSLNAAGKKADSLERSTKALEDFRAQIEEKFIDLDVRIGQLASAFAKRNQPATKSKAE